MEDKYNRQKFHFFFNHNLNSNLKLINPDNPLNNPIEFKGKGFFSDLASKNFIKKDLRGYPIIQNDNKQNVLKNLNHIENKNCSSMKNMITSQPIEYNKDSILDQISHMIDAKTKNKENNFGLNLNNPNNNNKNNFLIPDTNNIKVKKNIIGKCFQNTPITSINSIKFENKIKTEKIEENLNLDKKILTYEYNPNAKSVISFSYNEDKNIKSKMEDFHLIIDNFMSSNKKGYFSLFDGHGIDCIEPTKYATCRFPNILIENLQNSNYNIEQSLINSFKKIDDELKKYSQIENCGSTATIILIDKELNLIYSANVGDSKSILINKNRTYKNLTTEHKVESNYEENERIKKLGGLIFNGRLFGQLVLSRALGDFSLKNNGLISIPSIHKILLNEDDCFIVIASDGIWDVLSEDDITNICIDNYNLNCDELGKFIVKKAIDMGSEDNISCIIVLINDIIY
jgi:serine/threonine protein phosphatase PrpC